MEKVESTSMEYQGWDAWADKFKPIKNHLDKNSLPNMPSLMFETYGEEWDFIKEQDPRYVWTWVTGDMCDMIVAGRAFVNRFGYYVTEVPWDDDMDSVLLSVEVECDCYNEDEDVMDERGGEYGDPDCKQCEGYGLRTEWVN